MNAYLRLYLSFTVSQGARIIFAAIGMALLARILGPAGLGRWAMIIAVATLIHLVFASWIQDAAFVRFGKDEWTREGKLDRTWGSRLPFLIGGASLLVLAWATPLWTPVQKIYQLSRLDGLLAMVFFLSTVICLECQGVLQITRRMHRLAIAPAIVAAMLIPAYGLARLPAFAPYRLEAAFLASTGVTTAIWLKTAAGSGIRLSGHLGRWDSELARKIFRYAWPILPSSLLGYLVNWGNQVLIHRNFSSAQVGLYQSAFQIHALMITLAVPFTTIIFPRLIEKNLEDPQAMRRYVQIQAPSLFCLWLLISIPITTLVPWFYLLVFGSSFREGLQPLLALLICTPLTALSQIYTVLYNVQGKLHTNLVIHLIIVIVNFTGAWIWIPPGGPTIRSVALAFAVSVLFAQFMTFYYQHHMLRESPRKTGALFAVGLFFSLGQMGFASFAGRLAWGAIAVGALIWATRAAAAVNPDLLTTIFSGRLHKMGDALRWLLTANRKPSTRAIRP